MSIQLFIMSILLGASSFAVGMFPLSYAFSKTHLDYLAALGTGLLLGAALGVIIPEGIEATVEANPVGTEPPTGRIAFCLVLGFTLMLIVEQLLSPNAHVHSLDFSPVKDADVEFDAELGDLSHDARPTSAPGTPTSAPVRSSESAGGRERAFPLLLGLVIHGAADGLALGVANVSTTATGSPGAISFVVFLALILHKAPTSLAFTTSLLSTNLPRPDCKKYVAIFSASTPVAAIASYMIFSSLGHDDGGGLIGKALLISGGTFLYVATVLQPVSSHSSGSADMRPALQILEAVERPYLKRRSLENSDDKSSLHSPIKLFSGRDQQQIDALIFSTPNALTLYLNMSLSSLLLGKSAPIDTELDTLFKAPVAKPPVAGPSKESTTKKRKLDQENDAATEENIGKRSKASKEDKRHKAEEDKPTAPAKKKVVDVKSPKAEKKQKKEETTKKTDKKVAKKAEKSKGKGKEVAVESDEDDEELENAYLAGRGAGTAATKEGDDGSDKGEDDEDEDEEEQTILVHESVEKKTKKVRAAKTKFVPQDETPEQRDLRTIFVGNLPLDAASKKPLQKQLKNHILSFVPTAKIESIRFRSIPFQVPTAKLPDADGDGDAAATTKKPSGPRKEAREHVKERTSQWRSKQDEEDEESLTKDEKRFLNPAQKKKIAFINQEFHTTAGTVNAYIVFAHPPNTENRPANLPPLPPTMDPYHAARAAAEKCDSTFCLERMLRVDMVVKSKSVATALPSASTDADAEADEAAKSALLETDPRLSIFVGNLDFASKEEDLRVFFEGVVTTERGAPPPVPQEEGPEDATASKKLATWVTRVRIVRDKDTQLGKGFAYVQFADRECVDEVLALEETKLKFAKRKLRVQRCKTAPGGKNAPNVNNDKRDKSKSKAPRPTVIVPKGDPRLGEKLHGLPKEERKQLKSADADRVARRLAKKKARMAMAPSVGKEKGKGKGASKGAGKERKRVRS
ncbi:hypothetical protein D9619_007095 [Psilocybe cf. subviscida]|uniref:RRM domain-containing protein n=1 Tax=Psilocybe cf. subviscida TaxID=2480587 RepID=A0A8H5B281_9AGAR|nr:hypothetical protein D9619_007095 [Psilocybe cf. subviscida]